MSIRSHRLARLGAVGVLLAAGLLSGCGVSDEQLRPGVAAQVGETEVSLEIVDDAVDVACGFFVDQGQVGFPRSLARQQFVSVLVQRAAASAALEEAGLSVPGDYEQAGGLDATNEQIPEAQRAPFVLLNEATAYVDAAATALGEAAFRDDGTEVPTDPAEVTARGREVIADWITHHDVAINPVFRLGVEDGQVVTDTGTSVPVSDLATATLLDPQTATEAQVVTSSAQLPPNQLCGVATS